MKWLLFLLSCWLALAPIALAHDDDIDYMHLPAIGQSSDDLDKKLEESKKEIQDLESKLQATQQTAQTLTSQIKYMDSQITLSTLRIKQLENDIQKLTDDIGKLSIKIVALDDNLNDLAVIFAHRIRETYKQSEVPSWGIFLSADSLSTIARGLRNLQTSQLHDRQLLLATQQAKTTFEQQKNLKEEKQLTLNKTQDQLVSQKKLLDQQKQGKQALLTATRSDEKRFQELLSAARAEQAAIQGAINSIINNLKDGTPVEKGQQIALMGNSGSAGGCSTAAHLHFEVTDNKGIHRNPAEYLSSNGNYQWDLAPDSPFPLTGSWDWPMKHPRITQAYGYTWWAKSGFYGGKPHTGIDMVDDTDIVIRAPRSGTLFKGTASCRGKPMNYVAVKHDDNLISWYWHVR